MAFSSILCRSTSSVAPEFMAFSSILRRSAASVAPLTLRALRNQRDYHSANFTAINENGNAPGKPSPIPCFQAYHLSTTAWPSSDDDLRDCLKNEIQCEESMKRDQVVEKPSGFSFKIEDEPGCQTIVLTRENQGEEIRVEASTLDLVAGDDDEKANIPLAIFVTNKSGACLAFRCTACDGELVINALSIKNPEISKDQIVYEGHFPTLDEDLQKAFYKYLKSRGIEPTTTDFLHNYMVKKEDREYLIWLKNLKQFV